MQKNTETKYLERYAKELLERAFPDQYARIRISEKPDMPDLMMSSSYGIEVVWAKHEGQSQAYEILDEVKGQRFDVIDPIYKYEIDQINARFITDSKGEVIGYDPGTENRIHNQDLLKAYWHKKKSFEHYQTESVDLFVFPPLAQLDGWLGKDIIEDFFSNIHGDYTNPFHNIIVYEEPTLYLYNVKTNKVQIKRETPEVIKQSQRKANDYSGWSGRKSKKKESDSGTETKPTLFISYNHKSKFIAKTLAEKLDCIADVIWDEKLSNWRRFSSFMDSIRKQDYVTCIISDDYLKSINCMYEAMQLMNETDWDKKSMFILEGSAENIYDCMTQVSYIDYWASEEEKARRELNRHDAAAESVLKRQINRCAQIKWHLTDFLAVVADVKNPKLEDAIEAVIERMKISAGQNTSKELENTILILIHNGITKTDELATATNRSTRTIRQYLRRLRDEGKITVSDYIRANSNLAQDKKHF